MNEEVQLLLKTLLLETAHDNEGRGGLAAVSCLSLDKTNNVGAISGTCLPHQSPYGVSMDTDELLEKHFMQLWVNRYYMNCQA